MKGFKFTPIEQLKTLSRLLGQYNLNCGKYTVTNRQKDLIITLINKFPNTIEG